jgi:CHAD domain-containing protein
VAKAREIYGLSCDETFPSAAGKILWTRFEELMSFRDQIMEPASSIEAVDAVHDMRVASRRLRASLEAFVDIFPNGQYKRMLGAIKRLADSLGGIRDIDVLSQRLRDSRTGKTQAQRLALNVMIARIEEGRPAARARLESTILALERSDFRRRFALFVDRAV